MERFYRLAYNIFGVLSFLPLLALPVWLPDQPLYRIPFPWLILTLAIQGLAALIAFHRAAADRTVGFRRFSPAFRTGRRPACGAGNRWVISLCASPALHRRYSLHLVLAADERQSRGALFGVERLPGNWRPFRGAQAGAPIRTGLSRLQARNTHANPRDVTPPGVTIPRLSMRKNKV